MKLEITRIRKAPKTSGLVFLSDRGENLETTAN